MMDLITTLCLNFQNSIPSVENCVDSDQQASEASSSGSQVFSSPEQKAQGELIVWDWSRRPSVHPSVHTFKHEYL